MIELQLVTWNGELFQLQNSQYLNNILDFNKIDYLMHSFEQVNEKLNLKHVYLSIYCNFIMKYVFIA